MWEAPWESSEKAGELSWRERQSLGIELVGFLLSSGTPREAEAAVASTLT